MNLEIVPTYQNYDFLKLHRQVRWYMGIKGANKVSTNLPWQTPQVMPYMSDDLGSMFLLRNKVRQHKESFVSK